MRDHPKLAVNHLVSAGKPQPLQLRLLTDLELAYYSHNNNVKEYMKRAMNVAEAFHIVDNAPTSTSRSPKSRPGPSSFDSRTTKENKTILAGTPSSARSSRRSSAGQTLQDFCRPNFVVLSTSTMHGKRRTEVDRRLREIQRCREGNSERRNPSRDHSPKRCRRTVD